MQVYISKEDKPDIDRIRELAESKGKSMSKLIVQLLRRWEREVTR